MTDYRSYEQVPRFQLDRRPGRSRLKLKCPQCGGERCLTPYIDTKTGQPVGDIFGRCDHERRCGYDKRPTGKDVGDRELWISGNECYKAFRPPAQPNVINYINQLEVSKTVNPDYNNTMFRFLSTLWDPYLVSDVFRKYYVGTMDLWGWKGCSIFWQMDINYVCRTGKIMEYYIKKDELGMDCDIKRVKDDYPHVMFYHSLKGTDFLFKQCLFGEHLLNHFPKEKRINLVEAEKTAIICAINRPDKLFLATGGLQNMRPEVIRVLAGRDITVYPDKGEAFNVWKQKIERDLPGFRIKVSDCLQNIGDIEDGGDLADLIIKNRINERAKKEPV